MGNPLAWIELVGLFGLALGTGLWQYFKMDRELKRSRAERAAREEQAGDQPPAPAPEPGKRGG